jgi:hypothetical protein
VRNPLSICRLVITNVPSDSLPSPIYPTMILLLWPLLLVLVLVLVLLLLLLVGHTHHRREEEYVSYLPPVLLPVPLPLPLGMMTR